MRDKFKKISSLLAGLLLCGAMASLAGCSDYSPKKLQGNISGEARSNGGFVVEKGDYTYFINGVELSTANNTLGKVEKGALVRIKTEDLQEGDYSGVETVVPALFVAGKYTSGIYIYGDYVYFASPATEKNRDGTVANNYLNFKRAKIDGSSTEKELKKYFFRVDDNTVEYRFVEVDDVVYCMYVEDGTLHSFNTKTKKNVTLVEGASSEYFFDKTDLTNPTVYYTMAVTYGADSDNPLAVNYNQVYAVNAAATATVNEKECSYTTSYGYTYDFDKKYLKDQDEDFDAGDYTQYPYVNLGELVLDGVGSDTSIYPADSMFNHDANTPATPNGYIYTIQGYHTDGLYLSRADVNTSGSDGENAALYYLADSKVWDGDDLTTWASIAANATLTGETVAWNTTTATASAIYLNENGKHSYFYVDTTLAKIYHVHAGADGSEERKDELAPSASSAVLAFADETYLYYYQPTDKDGKNASGAFLYRVNYRGTADDYYGLPSSDEFKPQQILDIDVASANEAWYAPEFVGNVLLYPNAQAIGSVSYNYIYAVNLQGEDGMMTYAELDAFNQKYADVIEHIEDFATPYEKLSKALKYYFLTGETKVFDDFIAEAKAQGYDDHYRFDAYELETFAAFTAHTGEYADTFKDGETYFDTQSYFYNQVGPMKSADEKAIAKVWTSSSYIEALPEVEKEDNSGKVWMIVGISVGGVLVIAAVTTVVVYYVNKKRKLARDYEATRVKKRAKIDVSDDKSIDVYADEDASEAADSESEENQD